MSTKQKILDMIIQTEAGYVNDPDDSGGETNCGITIKTAREYGYTGEMEDMPVSLAYEIYSNRYWDRVKGDDLDKLSPALAYEVADTAVNCGVPQASLFLQRSLNALNCQGKYYSDLRVDGNIGVKTVDAIKALKNVRGDDGIKVLITMLNCLQGVFYVNLVERREKDEKFIYGWFKNRILQGD